MLTLIVIIIDILFLNALYFIAVQFGCDTGLLHPLFIWNACYAFAVLMQRPVDSRSRMEPIVTRALITSLVMAAALVVFKYVYYSQPFNILYAIPQVGCIFVSLLLSRFLSRLFFKKMQRFNFKQRSVIFVGAGPELTYIQQNLKEDLSTGYQFIGYFNERPSDQFPGLKYLGRVEEVCKWLEKNPKTNSLFCNLGNKYSETMAKFVDFCDNHYTQFFHVSDAGCCGRQSTKVMMFDEMPLHTTRPEPLATCQNCMIKHVFDYTVAGIFVITCFWWIYLIVALITKITMPGPVLFKQKRNGFHGEEFTCLKFRSMKINDQADTLQATKDDPRVTRWGRFLRKTSIDELPQFLNVLRGEMSVVGPRPHMVKHTQQYSALIKPYMARHCVLPGITGWAQVNGARGETRELWQMEDRVKKDIWYIENWSLWLDIKIVFLTVWKGIVGDKKAF